MVEQKKISLSRCEECFLKFLSSLLFFSLSPGLVTAKEKDRQEKRRRRKSLLFSRALRLVLFKTPRTFISHPLVISLLSRAVSSLLAV